MDSSQLNFYLQMITIKGKGAIILRGSKETHMGGNGGKKGVNNVIIP